MSAPSKNHLGLKFIRPVGSETEFNTLKYGIKGKIDCLIEVEKG
jgi:hypothetical protein